MDAKKVQCDNCGFWTEIDTTTNGNKLCRRCSEKLYY